MFGQGSHIDKIGGTGACVASDLVLVGLVDGSPDRATIARGTALKRAVNTSGANTSRISPFSVGGCGYVVAMSLFGVSAQHVVAEAAAAEAEIARLRHRQVTLLSRVYLEDTARANGAASPREWVASRLDVSPETASALVASAQAFGRQPAVRSALEDGDVTFDRACELFKQPLGAADVAASRRFDIAGLRRLAAKQRRLSRHRERDAYTHRYMTIQPNLDESLWDLHGRLAGIDGAIVEKALYARSDELRALLGGDGFSRGQLCADALVAMANDSLNHDPQDANNTAGNGGAAVVSVFIDMDTAAPSRGETGVEIEYGPRVGPAVLEELLCHGAVQIIGLHNARPIVASDTARAIPAAIRRFVAARDGGCTVDGCQSRYRLEPHHIVERRHGGSHDPDNLTTLCWFHHHVVIHGSGFHIDPASEPRRVRFTRARSGRAPPRR